MRKFLIKLLRLDKEILTELVRDLFNSIDEDDILQEGLDGKWYVGDKQVQDAEKNLVISEAQLFLKSTLWRVLQKDVKYQANLRMFVRSKTAEDIIAGKLLLLLLDIVNTRLQSLNKGKGSFNLKP